MTNRLWGSVLFRRLALLAVVVSVSSTGCDAVDATETVEPCDPLEGEVAAFSGTLDIALEGKDIKLFTVEDEVQRRLFVQEGSFWQERKVTGMGLSPGKAGDRSVYLSLADAQNKSAVLGYEVEDGALNFGGYVVTEKDYEGKEEMLEDPALVSLAMLPNFAVPPQSQMKTLGLGKSLRFFAKFEGDKYVVVVNADQGEPGLYVGAAQTLDGAQNIEIARAKDGGSLRFDFVYQGKKGRLSIPPPRMAGEPGPKDPAELSFDETLVKLDDVQQNSVPNAAIEGLRFRGCKRAHAGKS